MDTYNPCITCGSCCAYFRVAFYWTESDLATRNGVPHELTDHLWTHYLVMKGTDSRNPCCIALKGIIGFRVHCETYDRRSSVCRNFEPSWLNGEVNELCDKARARWGLPPLERDSGNRPQPDNYPKAA
ncbi:MAG: YkgJ family cysteine cluster protein [Desulfobulbaceae bacterium]|nr:YkgJ family cysteine cluster protein [Desulfobulbaceae bacterium]